MEPNVENFMKNFSQSAVAPEKPNAASNSATTMNPTPVPGISSPFDMARLAAAGGDAPIASASNKMNVNNANSTPSSIVDDLLDLRFDDLSTSKLPEALPSNEVSMKAIQNLAVGTPVPLSQLFAQESSKVTTSVPSDSVNASNGISTASNGTAKVIKDNMKMASATPRESARIHDVQPPRPMACASNAPNLKDALKDILNVHRDIEAQNKACELPVQKTPAQSLPNKQQNGDVIQSKGAEPKKLSAKSTPEKKQPNASGIQNRSTAEKSISSKSLPESKAEKQTPTNSLPKSAMSNEFDLDRKLKCELEEKKFSAQYQEFQKIRQELPIYQKKDSIIDVIEKNQFIVISGPTGKRLY
ncbi:nucleolar protein dao-5-like isoform X2 [Nilaparvata lugens]|uniref:nucleolar protein dao-5-like isoform X2 n=1 Tax=Nilaparvata lugens TaxID=108931 RepID=UPI00193DEDB8|nr:nucleolar protein dao-5-like isoform X2 [Nilaparvata lugens]